jgi:ferredoxin
LTDIGEARMGLAVLIDQENCLNFLGLRCDVCYRVCPVIDKAITLEQHAQPALGPSCDADPDRAFRRLHRLRQMREVACVLEESAIKVLPIRARAAGKAAHYRKGWEEKDKAGKSLIGEQIELPVRGLEGLGARGQGMAVPPTARPGPPPALGVRPMSRRRRRRPDDQVRPIPRRDAPVVRDPGPMPSETRAGARAQVAAAAARLAGGHPRAVPVGAVAGVVDRQGQPGVQPHAGRACR